MDVKQIPGTLGFKASINGDILDSLNRVRNQYTNGDGYKTVSVIKANGKEQTFGVHRLVALAFIPYNGNLLELTVNHIDGNIKNNKVKNLEWLSVAKNNLHAILLRGSKIRPVILAKDPNGKYEFISNLSTAAKKFNCDIDLVWESIRDNRELNGWKLVHHNRKKTTPNLPKELYKNNFPGGRVKGKLILRPIDILDLETQVYESFDSLHSAGIKFNVSTSDIYQRISTDTKKRLFKKRYLIVDKGKEFPNLSQEEYEELLSPGGKEVIAYNVKENKYYIYNSASQFIKEHKLSKKAVTVDLKKNRLRKLNDWWYTYNTPDKIERLNVAIKCPGSIAEKTLKS